jgi:4,5-dihydroxyphthalate decarboxylase
MSMHTINLSDTQYDRTEALRYCRVRAEGIDLTYIMLRVEEIFWRMAQHREFDASEFSLGGYVVRRGRGADDLVAIPVFPSRFFRQSCIFVHEGSGIRRPEDLRGKRIGVPEYQMTAAVWARGILADDYGVRAADVEWVQGGLEEPGRIPFEPAEPPGIAVGFAPVNRSLAQMLEIGEIDALVTARTPSSFRRGGGAVRRLFEHPFEIEREYFRRTGIFPIMHTLVVKKEILDANPWVAFTLFKAFSEAKDLAMADLTQTSALPLSLPFLVEHAYQTMDLMGEDFWPYGLESNRRTLETFVRYMHEQGLIPEPMTVETLFPQSTQRTFRV